MGSPQRRNKHVVGPVPIWLKAKDSINVLEFSALSCRFIEIFVCACCVIPESKGNDDDHGGENDDDGNDGTYFIIQLSFIINFSSTIQFTSDEIDSFYPSDFS